jgi:hypothetical protein
MQACSQMSLADVGARTHNSAPTQARTLRAAHIKIMVVRICALQTLTRQNQEFAVAASQRLILMVMAYLIAMTSVQPIHRKVSSASADVESRI